ncbi:ArsA-related P-loop ATPase [Capillimicrobium parvum]|uniref:CobQ/CobB/MinD/ParA nucleotide binding domain-containing protein n=1 Tax=Capillimicrobium parvum TaxID=2884022 RepID=A0A9E7BZB8_9ACTN|nr:ArsA-related P-loop ATPase [Capillimicrobium parvum]UGS34409.1 hypothetical protein DSM104329_00787 [Capillimicrobium parvum]
MSGSGPAAAALSRRLVFVTGKGGTGKTTAAAALALAARRMGRATVACEVSGHTQVPRLLGSETAIATMSIDPRLALREWLSRLIGGPGAALLTRPQTFGYFVAAAPGALELITLGKAWDLTRADPRRHREAFESVVLDGPSTGQAEGMLRAPSTYAALGRAGPVGVEAAQLRDAVADPSSSAVVVTTLLTELCVSETLEFAGRAEEIVGRRPDLVVVNQVLPDRFTALDLRRLRRAVDAARDPTLDAAEQVVQLACDRARSQARQFERLRAGVSSPIVELPFVAAGALGLRELTALSQLLWRPTYDWTGVRADRGRLRRFGPRPGRAGACGAACR